MIDFHSHILPGADDGAKTPEIALQMLQESYAQGVRTVISTSHCYITDPKSVQRFLEKRERCYRTLCDALAATDAPVPEIRLGAEVHMERDFSEYPALEELCIAGTNYILVEMPYKKWSPQLFDCLYSLKLRGLQPIMAHIERFAAQEKLFKNLEELDVLYQVNADSFLHAPAKRFVTKLYEKNMIHFLGSDMHDCEMRAPRMQAAGEAIQKKYGTEFGEYLQENAACVLENAPVESRSFPKLGFWEKLK